MKPCTQPGEHAFDPSRFDLVNGEMGNIDFILRDVNNSRNFYGLYHGCAPERRLPSIDLLYGPYENFEVMMDCSKLETLNNLNYTYGYYILFCTPRTFPQRIISWDMTRPLYATDIEYNFSGEFVFISKLGKACNINPWKFLEGDNSV